MGLGKHKLAIIFIWLVEETRALDPLDVHVEEQLIWRVIVRVGVHVHVGGVVARRWGSVGTHHDFTVVLIWDVEQIWEGQGLPSHSVEVGVAHGTLINAVGSARELTALADNLWSLKKKIK